MFADALLDSHHQSRRGWATVTSFGIQAIAVACLLIVPLFYTQVLPHISTSEIITVPPGPAPVPQVEPIQQRQGGASQNPVVGQIIQVPTQVPNHIDSSGDGEPLNPIISTGGGLNPSVGNGPQIGVIGGFGTAPVPTLEQPPAKPHPPHVSVMMEGSLIHRVEPTYPALARMIGVQGSVILAAVIGTDGSVQKLQVVSGHPLLVQAALNAVRQWRYRPYFLNGSPIEVDTQITVNFILAR